MRIATYNIWNSKVKQKERLKALYEVINHLNIDVLALQEVKTQLDNKNVIREIAHYTNYPHYYFAKYPDDEEGLAILSKYPIMSEKAGWDKGIDSAIRVVVNVNGCEVAFTNVHLTYECALKREHQIVDIIKWIDYENRKDRHEFLLGDFNCYPSSSVYNYLLGQQSLHNTSTKSGWFDLAASYANFHNKDLVPTLDFINNPRWQGSNKNHMEIPARFDWILLKNCFPLPYPKINEVMNFGMEQTSNNQIVPSDHYGVLVDIKL